MTTLVLLPGFDGTGELFAPLEAHLSAPTQRVAFGEPRSPQDYLTVAEALIPEDQPVVLVAESFSGPIALELIRRGRRDYRALVLSATFAHVPHAAMLATMARTGLHRLGSSLLRKMVVEGLGLGFQGAATVREEVMRVVGALEQQVIRSRLEALIHFDASRYLGEIHVPVTVLCPTQDRLIPNSHSTRLATSLPRGKLVRIVGPHLLLQVAPARCASHIMALVDEVMA